MSDQTIQLPLGNGTNMPTNYCDVSAAQDGSLMAQNVVIGYWPLTPIAVDVSSATTTTIAPATQGKINNVARVILTVAGACTLTLTGAVNLVLPLPSAATIVIDMAAKPIVWTAAGAALALITSAAVRVCGKIDYFQS